MANGARGLVGVRRWLVAAGCAGLVAMGPPAQAAGGQLDPTFGQSGRVTTDFFGYEDTGKAVAVQSDDRIVLAGWANTASSTAFGLVRYTADGSLDPSFADGGRAWVGQGVVVEANDVAIQGDGKIVAAGNTGGDGDFGLVRLNPDGSLDQSFNEDGIVTTSFTDPPDGDSVNAVAIQGDGKIVAAGCADCDNLESSLDFALARYNSDGSLDTTFGSDGKVTTDFSAMGDDAFAVAVQADGMIVAAGWRSAPDEAIALARYQADGTLDPTFGDGGKVTTPLANGSAGKAIVLQPDGKIVVLGSAQVGPYQRFALVRYLPDGTLDPTFGSTQFPGRVVTGFGPANDFAVGVSMQADRKIVVSGYGDALRPRIGSDALLARYTPAGQLDPTFDGDGRVRTPFRQGSGFDVGIQSDGRIVIGGTVGDFHAHFDFAAARYLP